MTTPGEATESWDLMSPTSLQRLREEQKSAAEIRRCRFFKFWCSNIIRRRNFGEPGINLVSLRRRERTACQAVCHVVAGGPDQHFRMTQKLFFLGITKARS